MVYLSSIELDWFPETLETPLDPPVACGHTDSVFQ